MDSRAILFYGAAIEQEFKLFDQPLDEEDGYLSYDPIVEKWQQILHDDDASIYLNWKDIYAINKNAQLKKEKEQLLQDCIFNIDMMTEGDEIILLIQLEKEIISTYTGEMSGPIDLGLMFDIQHSNIAEKMKEFANDLGLKIEEPAWRIRSNLF